MLNDIEEKRKNELLNKMDAKTLSDTELGELRVLTKKAIDHLVFNRMEAA